MFTNPTGFPYHIGEMIDRIVCCAEYMPKSEWYVKVPSIIRVIGSIIHVKKRLVMLQHVVDLIIIDMMKDKKKEKNTTINILNICFQQDSWLNALIYSPLLHLYNNTMYNNNNTATPYYFREEIILSILT